MKRRKFKSIILIIITTLYITFIWYNSLKSGVESSLASGAILKFLNNLVDSLSINYTFTELFVRKTAHFVEFAGLGLLVMWTFYVLNSKTVKNYLQCSFICLATAVADEFIQLFSVGRVSAVSDVILDYSGALFGFLLISVIILICRKAKKR